MSKTQITETASETTLFVDNLTVIDFSYLCPQRGIVGESWIVDLQLSGQLDQQGMIFDFGHVKKQVKRVIDGLFDHKLLIPTACEAFQLLSPLLSPDLNAPPSHAPETDIPTSPERLVQPNPKESSVRFEFTYHPDHAYRIEHTSPREAICLLPIDHIAIETVLPFIKEQIDAVVPDNVASITLNLRTEESDQPFYQYSHGLQFHDGDCQRIAHGHRSRIHIYIDGQRNPAEEAQWCQQWQTVYIATQHHIKAQSTLNGTPYLTMAYEAEQGFFQITLPKSLVHTITTESTVELIAAHIALTVAERHRGKRVMIKAFEGVHKGAIAVQHRPKDT